MERIKKELFKPDDAQAVMIGFVMILGILLSASTMYFASQIPVWTKDNEARHVAAVANDLSQLKKLIDTLKGAEFERTATIKMAPDKASILTSSPPGSNLLFDPGAEAFEVIIPVGGGGSGGGNWTIPNATLTFTEYCNQNNSKQVDTSFSMVRLAAPTTAHLILDNTQMELSGSLISPYVYYYNEVTLTNNSVLYVKPNTGVLKIFATSITIDASSKIDANGSGSPGGAREAQGSGTGRGYPPSTTGNWGNAGGGAGYGGGGGKGGGNQGGAGGTTYDSRKDRTLYMGSGGAGGTYHSQDPQGTPGAGGAGGGAVWLDAETINIAGAIFANGADGEAGTGNTGGGGGGSGGGILISGRSVTITGTLSARGGNGGQGCGNQGDGGGGGGGGRIKVFYDQLVSNEVWSAERGEEHQVRCPGATEHKVLWRRFKAGTLLLPEVSIINPGISFPRCMILEMRACGISI
ncbi:MAG: hypothetical protein EFT35_00920 [Methanophagales archaeon ANME-1-THS]|nr:MAG: hypothetical protein EFT35_00920 [Methanophagales archaeon ANME-1-THS]